MPTCRRRLPAACGGLHWLSGLPPVGIRPVPANQPPGTKARPSRRWSPPWGAAALRPAVDRGPDPGHRRDARVQAHRPGRLRYRVGRGHHRRTRRPGWVLYLIFDRHLRQRIPVGAVTHLVRRPERFGRAVMPAARPSRRSPTPSCGWPRRSSRRRALPPRGLRPRARCATRRPPGSTRRGRNGVLPRAENLVARRDLVGMQHPFAVIPSAADRPATRWKPSTSRIFRYGPSIARTPRVRAAIRIRITMC